MLIAFIGSLNPWFLWPFGNLYVLFSLILLVIAYALRPQLISLKKKWFLPALTLLILLLYNAIVRGTSIRIFVFIFTQIYIYIYIMCLNENLKKKVIEFISSYVALICMISLMGYIVFLFSGLGFSPSIVRMEGVQKAEYFNYYLFLVNIKVLSMENFPRFHAVFLEPGHIAVASFMLIYAQKYNLKKWYNKMLLITIVFSFSLAGYLLAIFGYFVNKFLYENKLYKLIVCVVWCVFVVFFVLSISVEYNNGNNLVNEKIISRLEIDEYGYIRGDNRVGDEFKIDYNNFLHSSDIWLGKRFDPEMYYGGNAGYRVYLYSYGLVGLFLLFLFYLSCTRIYPFKVSFPLLIINLLVFWNGGTPLWFNLIIPYICALSIYSNNRV